MFTNIILVPYRNREKQLSYFLKNSWPLICDKVNNVKLVILEQSNDNLFNRGKLLNVGFSEYKDKTQYFITQDVDVNPLSSIIDIYNKDISYGEIEGIYNSIHDTLGGVIKITRKDIEDINGFPNNFWGWGCEDKALYNRSVFFNKKINFNIRNTDYNKDKYFKIFNDVDDRIKDTLFSKKTHFEYNCFHKLPNNDKVNNIYFSGLNNIKYKITKKTEISDNVEMLNVIL